MKIAEITSSLGLSIKFESRNVNAVAISDIKAVGNGVLLLGGRVEVFLPNVLANKVLSTEELNKTLASNVWAESFWIPGKDGALLMAVTADGLLSSGAKCNPRRH